MVLCVCVCDEYVIKVSSMNFAIECSFNLVVLVYTRKMSICT